MKSFCTAFLALAIGACTNSGLDLDTPEGRCAAARVGLAAAAIILTGEEDETTAARLAKAAALVELYCAVVEPVPNA